MADIGVATVYILGAMETEAPDTLEPLRKRLLFRAHHMGMHENDILFGAFAERYVASFTLEQLQQFQRLIAENDVDLLDWVTGRKPLPERHDNEVARLLLSFELNA